VSDLKVSVIIPTHNRPDKLADTVACLKQQNLAPGEYEIIVVDDGSSPAVEMKQVAELPRFTLVRLEGLERSAARNSGAAIARGSLLVFVDDDGTVGSDFLASHLHAQAEWPGALGVGAVSLPNELLATPFGRFRQELERRNVPTARGLTPTRNFCTAQNMSIPKSRFDELGGFKPDISSGEDQELGLRHTAHQGQIVFLPEAETIHNDSALDIRSYCRRSEWGMEHMVPFCQHQPDWPDNVDRDRVNGLVRIVREPLSLSARKLIKSGLSFRPVTYALFGAAWVLEQLTTNSVILDRVYRLLLGVHILKGYRRGLKRFGDLYKQGNKTASELSHSAVVNSKT
jgi:GT2 family glycosyltransferase